jgi:hypothetical protein
VPGLAYWYALLPLHALVFRGMLNRIAAQAVSRPAEAFARPVPQTDS